MLLDGRSLQSGSLASLRAQMGVVFLDTFLFNISLRQNIRMGRLAASDLEVEEARLEEVVLKYYRPEEP